MDCLAWGALRQRSYALVNRYLEAGLEHCTEHGLDHTPAQPARLSCPGGARARALERGGRLGSPRPPRAVHLRRTPRILALVVLGLVRARRGDPEVWPPLDEALALAEPSGELLRIAPVAAARAEAAWLEGEHEAVAEATEAALDLAVQRQASWVIGELAYWRWRAGIREEIPADAAEPYALQMRGEWARAAALWAEIGCPYEAALALADADDDDALRGALAELQRLRCPSCSGDRRSPTAQARRPRAAAGTAPRDTKEPCEPDSARARGARARRARASQRGNRRAPLPRAEDGRQSCLGDPAQAQRAHARPGKRRGSAARARRPRSVAAPSNLGRSPDAPQAVGPVPSRKAPVGAMKTANQRSEGTGRSTDEPLHTIPIQASDCARACRRHRRSPHRRQEQRSLRGSSTRRREQCRAAGQFARPPGATVEPVAAPLPGATVEPLAAPPLEPRSSRSRRRREPALPPGATVEPVAASTVQPSGVQAAPARSSPVVEVRGGLDWADAGVGAGIAFGGILLLGGALLVVRRSGQRHRLATH